MPLDPLTTDLQAQRLIAGGVFVASMVIAFAFLFITRFITRKYLTGVSGTGVSERTYRLAHSIMRATSRPGSLFLLILGAMIALLLWPDAEPWHGEITTIGGAALVIVGAFGLSNVFLAVANWYSLTIAISTKTNLDDRILPVARRVIPLTVYAIGGLIVLDMLGISISPLLGGLGITGLAVALALQPTLSNFFAGTNILSEGVFTEGDYIELQGGPAGYVQSVGLRSTKIRTWLNNDVIIPNSVLSSSIMVNYSRPDPADERPRHVRRELRQRPGTRQRDRAGGRSRDHRRQPRGGERGAVVRVRAVRRLQHRLLGVPAGDRTGSARSS